jgi:hypothetical protein
MINFQDDLTAKINKIDSLKAANGFKFQNSSYDLKGQHILLLQSVGVWGIINPGRCPGLSYFAPSVRV